MNSIYEHVLGADFHRLHPQIQRRFGFSSSDGIASIGRGVMDEIWKGRFYTEPFLWVGSWRRIMFPETGQNIPFTIENYAFVDQFGRETVSWIRTFESQRSRRFDAYMVYSDSRRRIVDYLGTHQHLAVGPHRGGAAAAGDRGRGGGGGAGGAGAGSDPGLVDLAAVFRHPAAGELHPLLAKSSQQHSSPVCLVGIPISSIFAFLKNDPGLIQGIQQLS